MRQWSALLLVFGTLLIVVSSIGFWIQWTIMSERGFVEVTGNVITAEQSRATIARAVVDQLFADVPILRSLVRDPLEGLISGILGSSLFVTVFQFVSERIWEAIFVNRSQISLDISPLRNILYGIISAIAPDVAARITPADIPDELVLLSADALPDLTGVSTPVAFGTWIAFFGGIAMIIIALMRAWAQPLVRYTLFAWTGILLIIQSIILGFLTFPTQTAIVVGIENSTGRSLIATTLTILTLRLYVILAVFILVSIVLIVVGLIKRRELLAPHLPQPGTTLVALE
jgi:hypothetical protein